MFLPRIVGGSDIPVPFFSVEFLTQLLGKCPTNFPKLFRYGLLATNMAMSERNREEFLMFVPRPGSYPWREPGKAPRLMAFQDQLVYKI